MNPASPSTVASPGQLRSMAEFSTAYARAQHLRNIHFLGPQHSESDSARAKRNVTPEAKIAEDHGLPWSFLAQYYQKDEYADIRVLLRDRVMPAHKIVICSQSPMIKAMLNGCFKESVTSDVPLQEYEPHLIECMLEFMYQGNYSDLHVDDMDNSRSVSMILHIDMCITADYFENTPLYNLATQKYAQLVAEFGEANALGDPLLESLEYIYQKAPDHLHGIRELGIRLAKQHRHVFTENAESRARFEAFCVITPEFLHDIMEDWFVMQPARPAPPKPGQ